MIAQTITGLLETGIAGLVATTLVLVLRKPARALFGARAAYALWLLVPVAAIAMLVPASTLEYAIVAAPPAAATPGGTPQAALSAAPIAFDPKPWLLALWSAGAAASAAMLAIRQHRFRRELGPLQQRGDGTWISQSEKVGPMLLGAWRGRIVVPRDFDARYSADERDLVLRHERAHLARRDLSANLVAAILRCVHWFNPLLHFAFRRYLLDQELAADALVLVTRPTARRAYADAMLKTQCLSLPPPLGCHWQPAYPLRERIMMLKQPLPGALRYATGVLLAFSIAASTGYAAWASQPANKAIAVAPASTDGVLTVSRKVDGKSELLAQLLVEPGIEKHVDSSDGLRLSLTVASLTADQAKIDARLQRDGEVLAEPSVLIERGTAATITLEVPATGDSGSGVSTGVTYEVQVSRQAEMSEADKLSMNRRWSEVMNRSITLHEQAPSLRAALQTVAAAAGFGIQNLELAPADGPAVALDFDAVPALEAIDKLARGGTFALMLTVDGGVLLVGQATAQTAASAPDAGSSQILEALDYPADAFARKAEGLVVLAVHVSEEGKPLAVEFDPQFSSPELDTSLIKASVDKARTWQFEPQRNADGKAVARWVRVPIQFDPYRPAEPAKNL